MCESKSGFTDFNKPDVELVIWQRSLSKDLHSWIKQAITSAFPEFRLLISPRDTQLALELAFDECGLRAGAVRGLFIRDICDLVEVFAETTFSDLVDVRLERIHGDACWKFHRDSVRARLLTTYLGPTTEWVRETYADEALGKQKYFKGPLERLGLNDVAMFSGSSAGHKYGGVVHRSPPIAGTGEVRLLLCLNQETVVSPDLWVRENHYSE